MDRHDPKEVGRNSKTTYEHGLLKQVFETMHSGEMVSVGTIVDYHFLKNGLSSTASTTMSSRRGTYTTARVTTEDNGLLFSVEVTPESLCEFSKVILYIPTPGVRETIWNYLKAERDTIVVTFPHTGMNGHTDAKGSTFSETSLTKDTVAAIHKLLTLYKVNHRQLTLLSEGPTSAVSVNVLASLVEQDFKYKNIKAVVINPFSLRKKNQELEDAKAAVHSEYDSDDDGFLGTASKLFSSLSTSIVSGVSSVSSTVSRKAGADVVSLAAPKDTCHIPFPVDVAEEEGFEFKLQRVESESGAGAGAGAGASSSKKDTSQVLKVKCTGFEFAEAFRKYNTATKGDVFPVAIYMSFDGCLGEGSLQPMLQMLGQIQEWLNMRRALEDASLSSIERSKDFDPSLTAEAVAPLLHASTPADPSTTHNSRVPSSTPHLEPHHMYPASVAPPPPWDDGFRGGNYYAPVYSYGPKASAVPPPLGARMEEYPKDSSLDPRSSGMRPRDRRR